ncbi:MAG: amino acid permease, partial [Planctomycetes bacterium]|nr:amino acid permease [Planctomycetota bacterium]
MTTSSHKQETTNPRDADPAMPIAPTLGLWDAVAIIVGIVVGTAIFKLSTGVFNNVSGPWQAMGVWLLGGVLSLIGALVYAELATTYPRSGGDYHYLTKAYGNWVGFLFGWAQLAVILTGSIAAMAYAFADYAATIRFGTWQLDPEQSHWIAVVPIAVLTILNLLGIVVGKVVQNLLSIVKVVGLLGIVVAGLFFASQGSLKSPGTLNGPGIGLALVFVLYAFGGWNDAAFVAAEVRGQKRNLPLALFLGIGIITVVYLLVIFAYMSVLGFEGARQTDTPATAVLERVVGSAGGVTISVLVVICALGAINGLVLTGSRVYASLGADHRVFGWLAGWSGLGAPVAALVAQAVIAVALVLAVGTTLGRGVIDGLLAQVGISGLDWDGYGGKFETVVVGT